MTLKKTRRALKIAHENYRVKSDEKRWQKFNLALKNYIRALQEEEKRKSDLWC